MAIQATSPLSSPQAVYHVVRPGTSAASSSAADPVAQAAKTAVSPTPDQARPGASAAPAATASDLPRQQKLGDKVYTLEAVLGKGSFGTVYSAYQDGAEKSESVAVKEILCKTDKERAQAELEAKLLKTLSGALTLPESPGRGERRRSISEAMQQRIACPQVFATETKVKVGQQLGPWTVRIAMSKVPGVPLDDFAKIPANRRGFARSVKLCKELLLQMCPTLSTVAPVCVHRDVNAHNILLEASSEDSKNDGAASEDVFTLIDFGLACETKSWRQGEWKSKDIGGDCRYWPVSCWKMFLFGWKYLAANAPQMEEYVYNLDAHTMALTCIQLLVEVTTDGAAPDHAKKLFEAWQSYWAEAVKFHSELFTVFRGRGTWDQLKRSFVKQQIAERTATNLVKIRQALTVCAAGEAPEGAVLFQALERMLSGATVNWETIRRSLAQERQVPVFSSLKVASSHTTGTESPPEEECPRMRFAHRRNRTLDMGDGFIRGVPELGAAGGLRSGSPQLQAAVAAAPGTASSATPLQSPPGGSPRAGALSSVAPGTSPSAQLAQLRPVVASAGHAPYTGPSPLVSPAAPTAATEEQRAMQQKGIEIAGLLQQALAPGLSRTSPLGSATSAAAQQSHSSQARSFPESPRSPRRQQSRPTVDPIQTAQPSLRTPAVMTSLRKMNSNELRRPVNRVDSGSDLAGSVASSSENGEEPLVLSDKFAEILQNNSPTGKAVGKWVPQSPRNDPHRPTLLRKITEENVPLVVNVMRFEP